jgi:hypothetical protein
VRCLSVWLLGQLRAYRMVKSAVVRSGRLFGRRKAVLVGGASGAALRSAVSGWRDPQKRRSAKRRSVLSDCVVCRTTAYYSRVQIMCNLCCMSRGCLHSQTKSNQSAKWGRRHARSTSPRHPVLGILAFDRVAGL